MAFNTVRRRPRPAPSSASDWAGVTTNRLHELAEDDRLPEVTAAATEQVFQVDTETVRISIDGEPHSKAKGGGRAGMASICR